MDCAPLQAIEVKSRMQKAKKKRRLIAVLPINMSL
jgi:hypothetical protein